MCLARFCKDRPLTSKLTLPRKVERTKAEKSHTPPHPQEQSEGSSSPAGSDKGTASWRQLNTVLLPAQDQNIPLTGSGTGGKGKGGYDTIQKH